ncbi:amidase [Yoonia sediminilitoris]|uniref:Asp-tRNA(Asn)/Glu-tRNA(Gln) amidotransferase A subunit family amidase n=1 Tax=Yoonia sediminilitoris TaxID=1286148 RepID=A0A2T6KM73_9RHOB|nr:amidase [Yoonia sediminilitoris]PUB17318.1 Asp-tRNA(Asn)/Glu-tRNA(Gln) amidotransferase A subunit family amidase [Yoonia sediminilitoris]RCW97613.1 Asp-tRNA(Asn)/Glu-tRNA(Gln) amidotransferase A subunit family amidase [Yoonia sediminilitoris]
MNNQTNLQIWDKHIHAFVTLSNTNGGTGLLAGIRVGVKDIIDAEGLPTRNGSDACADVPPALTDAPVVARLRAHGATIVGKTTTTEFAFTDPTPCRNPHDLRRSPGGSSSGSGAAVAAGVVDIALATQTAGSLCRPAAYCGVVGFKPTYGLVPTAGMTPLAPSFDTLGIIGRDITTVRRAFDLIVPDHPPSDQMQIKAISGLWETDVPVGEKWRGALAQAANALSYIGAQVDRRPLIAPVASIVTAHRQVMCAEAFAAHGAMLSDSRAPLLRPKFKAGLEFGRDITPSDFSDARNLLKTERQAFWDRMSDHNIMLTLPVPEGAPLIGDTTGYQDWLTPWTVFGGPLVCLPWGMDQLQRPASVMLAARPGQDRWLLEVAATLEPHAPPISAPNL